VKGLIVDVTVDLLVESGQIGDNRREIESSIRFLLVGDETCKIKAGQYAE